MNTMSGLNAHAQPFEPANQTQSFVAQTILDVGEAQGSTQSEENFNQLQHDFSLLDVRSKVPGEHEKSKTTCEPTGPAAAPQEAQYQPTTTFAADPGPLSAWGSSRHAASGGGVYLDNVRISFSSPQQYQQYSSDVASRDRNQRTSDKVSNTHSKKGKKGGKKGGTQIESSTRAKTKTKFKKGPQHSSSNVPTTLGSNPQESESGNPVDGLVAGFDDKISLQKDGTTFVPTISARKPSSKVPQLPVPVPSTQYIREASIVPRRIEHPQRLLIVIDLNGTVLFRPSRDTPTYFITRPKVKEFFEYLFANHAVMVWSSARPINVKLMCDKLFSPEQRKRLIAVWGRDTLGLSSEQYKNKVQVYKRLGRVWQTPELAEEQGKEWTQSNTLLIDDSLEKAKGEPYNAIQIPEFQGNVLKYAEQNDVLRQVVGYLEEAKWQDNVSAFVKQQKFVADGRWDRPWPLDENDLPSELRDYRTNRHLSPGTEILSPNIT